jgi:hypothetical protein
MRAWDSKTWSASDVGYAYDSAVPGNAKATRVVLADRLTTEAVTPHKKVAIAVYGDGHVGNCNRDGQTDDYFNKDAAGAGGEDNIYDNTGDGGRTEPGRGSTTRAFVM